MNDSLALVQSVDSLSANEFSVSIDGEVITGIFKLSGLAPFKMEMKPAATRLLRDAVRITKMVQRDPAMPVNRWVMETVTAKDDIVRPIRTLDISALDDGVEVRRWSLKGAYISELSYSDFDSGSGELVQETLVIQYEDVEIVWFNSGL
ncbi:MAG: phage tail protein [Pleurocapsa minor GSE-CHR-MK-17-07R]|jgi:hypothetical protein|nr:phage tail protein [Pleurocapsa minor GSE-CHR-MK 17-07R]